MMILWGSKVPNPKGKNYVEKHHVIKKGVLFCRKAFVYIYIYIHTHTHSMCNMYILEDLWVFG